ncbi:hypothetical protein GCM10014713_16520 [Streptomyces purpureus]|uniref:Uncharacterized protein n=1 Tax=Streptomyces purpureus TaxID=1951 RepID=A0A918GYM2_9ACTN|nr:hypothetical protein GCM10014713_16520 [Streptomyces purpureus]
MHHTLLAGSDRAGSRTDSSASWPDLGAVGGGAGGRPGRVVQARPGRRAFVHHGGLAPGGRLTPARDPWGWCGVTPVGCGGGAGPWW